MDAKSFATQMKGEIQDLKDQGVAAVFVDNLIAYLGRVENVPSAEPTPLEVEQYKAVLAQNLQAMLQNHNSDLEMFKSVITAGQNATRAMTAINGGAAVAMLAFLGHLAAIRSPVIPAYAGCMVPFVIGTLLAGLVSAFTYLTQFFYASDSKASQRLGVAAHVATIFLGIGSFIAFGYGAWLTYDTFVTLPPPPPPPLL